MRSGYSKMAVLLFLLTIMIWINLIPIATSAKMPPPPHYNRFFCPGADLWSCTDAFCRGAYADIWVCVHITCYDEEDRVIESYSCQVLPY